MKLHWRSAFLLLLGLGCDDAPAEGPAPVFVDDWATAWPQVRDCRLSIEHELAYIRVHADPATAEHYQRCVTPDLPCDAPFAEGAVIVKPQYRDPACTQLIEITAARRLADGWRWQVVEADGAVRSDGDLQTCVRCHSACDPAFDLMCVMDP